MENNKIMEMVQTQLGGANNLYNSNYISLSTVLSSTISAKDGIKEIGAELRIELIYCFKNFLLSKCRYNSKMYNTIYYKNSSTIKNCGLFNRLVFNFDRQRVEYIAGQDYTAEITELKKQFIKY